MTTFTVNGKTYTDEDLLIMIPRAYRPQFEGKAFRDFSHLSRAVMFASGLAEAEYYKREWVKEECERELKWQLAQCK